MYIDPESAGYKALVRDCPSVAAFTTPVRKLTRRLVGRDRELRTLEAYLARPEMPNPILLAEPGVGKTTLVQGAMDSDTDSIYLSVSLDAMVNACDGNTELLGDKLKGLADEVSRMHELLVKADTTRIKNIVLFIDEFHLIMSYSASAIEAFKPILADSGTRGVRVIAATTLEEFMRYVAPNQALMERLQRLDLGELGRDATISILRDMASRYGVAGFVKDSALYDDIYDLTNRFVPASAQPRKSINVFDLMIGWQRTEGGMLDRALLSRVIEESTGNRVTVSVDAATIRKRLDERVLAQRFATAAVESRLQICVADLNDTTRPMGSFLLVGPTGTGKDIVDDTPVPVLDKTGHTYWKRNGDLTAGDMVFNRYGKPVEVDAVFPHKGVDCFRVTLSDGRTLDVGKDHLFAVWSSKMRHRVENEGKNVKPYIMTAGDIVQKSVLSNQKNKRNEIRWYIPQNGAVEWPDADLACHPYVVGAMIGNGCLTKKALTFSSNDVECVDKIARLIGATETVHNTATYSWQFHMPEELRYRQVTCFQAADVLSDATELIGKTSREKRIPEKYMTSSIEQRWQLVQGLFDTDGTVSDDDRARVTYSTFSKQLANDVRRLLFSLGVPNTLTLYVRQRIGTDGCVRDLPEYTVHVKSRAYDKARFFSLSRKVAICEKWAGIEDKRKRVKKYGFVGIRSIEPIGKRDATCIYVHDEEHLYQAGDFVVTHNTELVKTVSDLLFGDARKHLIRFDMSEFSEPSSVTRFREDLTARIWEHPFSVIMLDEFEKSCGEVTRLMLSVLDDGRLTDAHGRVVSFTNCYIFLTSNAGSKVWEHIASYDESDTGDGEALRKFEALIRRDISSTEGNRFPPELLGRIDVIAPFQPLSRKTMHDICGMRIDELAAKVWKTHRVKLMTRAPGDAGRSERDRIISYICDDRGTTDTGGGGARAISERITNEITAKVAAYINANPDVGSVMIYVDGEMVSENRYMRTTDAHISVAGVA